MGLNLNLNAAESAGGSRSSAQNVANSFSTTDAASARAAAEASAQKAHERQIELLRMSQDYNSREAQKARDWEAEMANTIYTRSVKNMKEAGINPILAANMGLSGASVGSGATASVSTPSTFMGQGFMDQNSASHAEGSSFGSSWNNSESGLATFLSQMGELAMGIASRIQNGMQIDFNLEGLEKIFNKEVPNPDKTIGKEASKTFKDTINIMKNVLKK